MPSERFLLTDDDREFVPVETEIVNMPPSDQLDEETLHFCEQIEEVSDESLQASIVN